MITRDMNERLLTRQDVADLTGLTIQTIKTYRRNGTMPEHDYVIGRTPVWLESTIQKWRGIKNA
jgi:predicted DNA-binding transcriptional regulator AlpA